MITLIIVLLIIGGAEATTIYQNASFAPEDIAYTLNFSEVETLDFDCNRTHCDFTNHSWGDFLMGGGGNISVNSSCNITVYTINTSYMKINLTGNGDKNVSVKMKPSTDYNYFVDGSLTDTKTTDSKGRTNFIANLSEHQYILSESTNYAPQIENITNPNYFNPGVNGSIEVFVTDDDGLTDLTYINLTLHRNDTLLNAEDDARNHYTLTYDVGADTLTSSPDYAYLTDSIDTGATTDNLAVNWSPARYTAPSTGSGNTTINNYYWNISVTVNDGSTTNSSSNTTNVSTLTSVSFDTSYISFQDRKGTNTTYTPPINCSNTGNTHIDLNNSITNLTSSGSDVIPATNHYLDDDDSHDLDANEQQMQNNTQTWGLNLPYNSYQLLYVHLEIPSDISHRYTYSGNMTLSGVLNHVE